MSLVTWWKPAKLPSLPFPSSYVFLLQCTVTLHRHQQQFSHPFSNWSPFHPNLLLLLPRQTIQKNSKSPKALPSQSFRTKKDKRVYTTMYYNVDKDVSIRKVENHDDDVSSLNSPESNPSGETLKPIVPCCFPFKYFLPRSYFRFRGQDFQSLNTPGRYQGEGCFMYYYCCCCC